MADAPKISKLQFKAGHKLGAAGLELHPGTVTVFVGPNNSGKSLALREIENWCWGQNSTNFVLDTAEINFTSDPDIAVALLRKFEASPPENQSTNPGHFWIGQHVFKINSSSRHLQYEEQSIRTAAIDANSKALRELIGSAYTVRLDGRTRFALSESKPTGDLQQHPQNHLWALFKDDAARNKVRELTAEAFDLHFVIDPTNMQSFRIRMSSTAPTDSKEEQALDTVARAFHANAREISSLSDGVQAFVGLTSALLSLPHSIILIDEPEAFLHPPLARRLGSNLAKIAHDRDASLVTATHSSEFLIGCLEAVSDTSVVRFTYERGVATARSLSSIDVQTLVSDPLLRSTGVLRALFHRAAIITESDSDRAFYDEINRRLVSEGRGIADSLFLNAQNKQTLKRLVGPLRKIGVPAAAVPDLDVIKEGGTNWETLLDACRIPTNRRIYLETERAYLKSVFEALPLLPGNLQPIKTKGRDALGGGDIARFDNVIKELADYGLFVVPHGELESWLKHLGISGHGSDWLVNIFAAIGQSTTDVNYERPNTNDVWTFIDSIASWVNDPARKGTD